MRAGKHALFAAVSTVVSVAMCALSTRTYMYTDGDCTTVREKRSDGKQVEEKGKGKGSCCVELLIWQAKMHLHLFCTWIPLSPEGYEH